MKVIEISQPKQPLWDDAAQYLRKLADRFEKGEISEAVVVFNDKVDTCFESFGHFDDRWRILGALEYAKGAVNRN